jgi:hypothetical protein
VPTATTAPHVPPVKPVPTATPIVPKPGGGGTYFYTAPNETSLSHTTAARSSAPAASGAQSPTSLPASGGGQGGGSPLSPLAPLALLAAVAIVAGRVIPRIIKRQ